MHDLIRCIISSNNCNSVRYTKDNDKSNRLLLSTAKFIAISYILWCERKKIKSLWIYCCARERKGEMRSATETAVLVTWTILSICSPGTCRTLRRTPQYVWFWGVCVRYVYTYIRCVYTRGNVPPIRAYVHTRDVLCASASLLLLLENSIPSRRVAWWRIPGRLCFEKEKSRALLRRVALRLTRSRFTCVIDGKRTCMHR